MFDVLLTPEEKALKEEVRAFVRDEVPPQLLIDMDQGKVIYPREYVQSLAKKRLLGLRFPVKYGGRDLNWVAEMVAIEEISILGSSLACLYSLPSIVGEGINLFGNESQKERYLVPTIAGELFCAEALTEPRGGSDFFGATTTAIKKGDYYILNGQKRFVVGAKGADYFLVYAKTNPEAPPKESLSVFLVDRDMGVKEETLYNLMGTRGGGAGRIIFKDTKVPVENMLGKEGMGAEIFNKMMVPERLTSAAGAIGLARTALEIAATYSTRRKAFGLPIRKFEGVSFKVADAISKLDAARALVFTAAKMADSGKDPKRLVSEAKKIATDTCWEVVNHAMQIMGGIGYTDIYPIERMLRDARLLMIWTGTNEIMNLLIQHEYYNELKEMTVNVRNVEKDTPGYAYPEEKVYE